MEHDEKEQLYQAKEDKQSSCKPPGDSMCEVERPAQARPLFDKEAGIVAVDVETTSDPVLVVTAIARVRRYLWL